MMRAKRGNFFSVPPTGRDKKYICPLYREGPQDVLGGLFSKQTKFDKGEGGPISQFLVGRIGWMTSSNVYQSMYAYTVKCTSTFVYKLKLTDFLWYRDIGWYRDTRTGIIVAMTKSSFRTRPGVYSLSVAYLIFLRDN